MRPLLILISLLAIFAAEFASARSGWQPNFGPAPFPIRVEVLRTGGMGCPAGSVSAALSPDQSTLSVLFDKFGTQLAAGSGVLSDTKSCTITLGIKFDGQYRVAIVGSDVRGFASVPAQGSTSISIKHRSIYSIGNDLAKYMDFQKNIVGPSEQNILMSNRFPQKPMWSQCGSQMRYSPQIYPFMYIFIDIKAQTQNAQQDLISMIDSLDLSAAPLSYQIAWTPDSGSCPR